MKKKSIGEQNYENFAQRYATIAEHKPHNAYYNKPALLKMLPTITRKKVLDAGCGPGFFAEIFLERGAQLVAFDVTPIFIEITRNRIGDRASFHIADINQPLSFAESGEFDVVFSSLVLDYVEDLAPVFAEFHRVLKRNGCVLFSCSHPHTLWEFVKRKVAPKESDKEWNYFHVEKFTTAWGGFGEPKPNITSFRRPLSALINPLLQQGFRLDRIYEPQAHPDLKEIDPEEYETLSKEPCFIVIRATK